MLKYKRLCLITLHFTRIVCVALEVSALEKHPVNHTQLRQITVVITPIWIGVGISKNERQVQRMHKMQTRNQNHNFFIFALLNTPP